jgi:hypothetical protein
MSAETETASTMSNFVRLLNIECGGPETTECRTSPYASCDEFNSVLEGIADVSRIELPFGESGTAYFSILRIDASNVLEMNLR